jgi:hypothetical protein
MNRNKVGKALTLCVTMALAAGAITACRDDGGEALEPAAPGDAGTPGSGMHADAGLPDSGVVTEFTQPAGTVPVNFIIDDSANKLYDIAGGLAWKGSFAFDAATRLLTHDPGWSGPFLRVHDDGPWNDGGHEPVGATAGDNIWGITAFVRPGAEALSFEFAALEALDETDRQGICIWTGPNGTFSVPANADQAIDAGRLAIPAHGSHDLRLELTVDDLAGEFADLDLTSGVRVQGRAWGALVELVDDGTQGDRIRDDGVFTFVLSEHVGPGTPAPYRGLLATGDQPEFVFVLGGRYYTTTMGEAHSAGIGAAVRPEGGDWIPVDVVRASHGHNAVVVP